MDSPDVEIASDESEVMHMNCESSMCIQEC